MMIYPRKDIVSVYILADQLYRGGQYSISLEENLDFTEFDWYREALQSTEPQFIPPHMEQMVLNPRYQVFSVVRPIISQNDYRTRLGVIKIDANYDGITRICNGLQMEEGGGLCVIDKEENVIFSNLVNLEIEDLFNKITTNPSDNLLIVSNADSKEYLVSKIDMITPNWFIVAANPIDVLTKSARETGIAILYIALISTLVAVILISLLSKRLLKPLEIIVSLMGQVEKGDLSVQFAINKKDEIAYLGRAFNRMITQLAESTRENEQLLKEVYEARLLQSQAQMNALYRQIKPHFIYNTLNMISMQIQSDMEKEAVRNVKNLSHMLREMTNAAESITLAREMEIVNTYLMLQKSRYGDRLQYSIVTSPDVADILIPPFTLQPIVENAVVHGSEKRMEPTQVNVSARREAGCVFIQVDDNAGGMPEAVLRELKESIEDSNALDAQTPSSSDNKGIGLINVCKRIYLFYGPETRIHIESSHKGTAISIWLPA
jgi:two-component system sensor histidine kinase YesM